MALVEVEQAQDYTLGHLTVHLPMVMSLPILMTQLKARSLSKMKMAGSTYFFSTYPDFKPHDLDFVDVVEIDAYFMTKRFYDEKLKADVFQINKFFSNQEIIERHLRHRPPESIAKFLIPEIVKELKFTIDDLKQLKPLADSCKGKYEYIKMIYYFYLENNDFYLAEEQRLQAYENYKNSRR